jgi:hypothetical protein
MRLLNAFLGWLFPVPDPPIWVRMKAIAAIPNDAVRHGEV